MTQNNIWNKLLEFESRDLIERYIKKKFDRRASARQIMEISSNFIQAREYFRNAQHAAITVKPLLQYYGVSALARGLILAVSPHIGETSLTPSHGLNTFNWRASLATGNFGDLTVTITKGAFNDLLIATNNKSYFKHNSSTINWQFTYDLPAESQKFNFLGLVQTFPDLKEEFLTWTDVKLATLTLEGFKTGDDGYYEYIVCDNEKGNDAIDVIFPLSLAGISDIKINPGRRKTILTGDNYHPQFSQQLTDPFNAGIGTMTLTKPMDDKIYLNSIAQFYALSFFLGMLSRYYPSVWISIGRTEKGDAIYPLMAKIIDMIDSQAPKLVLEFLNGPYDIK